MLKLTLLFFILFNLLSANEKILILHSYNENLGWTQDINKGMKDVLTDKFPNAHLHVEYMDTQRHGDWLHTKNLFDTYYNKYAEIKFDLILTSDNNAFEFVKRYNKILFHKNMLHCSS